jgi:hypothetical protein
MRKRTRMRNRLRQRLPVRFSMSIERWHPTIIYSSFFVHTGLNFFHFRHVRDGKGTGLLDSQNMLLRIRQRTWRRGHCWMVAWVPHGLCSWRLLEFEILDNISLSSFPPVRDRRGSLSVYYMSPMVRTFASKISPEVKLNYIRYRLIPIRFAEYVVPRCICLTLCSHACYP